MFHVMYFYQESTITYNNYYDYYLLFDLCLQKKEWVKKTLFDNNLLIKILCLCYTNTFITFLGSQHNFEVITKCKFFKWLLLQLNDILQYTAMNFHWNYNFSNFYGCILKQIPTVFFMKYNDKIHFYIMSILTKVI